ncbi:uncharacterized protein LOC106112826 isoform X2 [Falco peregrinus]|uniref:uncharacterized protein LOC106112826 isoform X2 n=1 Tax=Falco peregrinus TaxID=8954 RepID=UPI000FFBA0A9|nr:uncharacterized protein LOC106112826 isoform X2 [Falco peregrinus]
MDNQAFEMHGENIQSSSKGKEWPNKEERKGSWSLMKTFLVCLLACVITTAIGVLVLSLVYVNNPVFMKETDVKDDGASSPKPDEKNVDISFQFMNHLGKSKVHVYPGGEIQWARFRKDANEYQSDEEMEFGKSINNHRSKMTFGTLRIKSKGLRAPHWHFNANEHGYLLQGTAWIGVIGADDSVVTTYSVTAGQVVFFPRNTVHWIKNVGSEDCVFLLFFTTHEELQTLDVDDAFFSTPEDIAARALKPQGGVNFIRTFKKQKEDQAINLPSNLDQLVQNASYVQSPDNLVWQYFYNLKGSAEYPFPGGIFQWARYRINNTGLNETEKIFSESLNKAGVILSGVTTNFNIGIGDVIFFPVGTQHYIKSLCDEDLFLILAYSTGNQLETLRMNDYFHATADHILAQLFFKEQAEFKKFPKAAKKPGK